MLVVHAFWAGDAGLGLWAEDAEATVKSRSQALRAARPHPFAAPADELAMLFAGKAGAAELRLPSLRSAPLDSPELVRVTPRPPAQSAPALLSWTVPAIWPPSPMPARRTETSDTARSDMVRIGATVEYLAEWVEFGRGLVDRGRMLPTVTDSGRARWRPVLRGADVVAFNALVSAMPPAFRCCPQGEAESTPHDIAVAVLGEVVDGLVRDRLGQVRLLPPRRGRAPRQQPAVAAWLVALTEPDGRFDADPAELAALVAALRPWDEVGAGHTGPARATFRLCVTDSEPDDGAAGWRLEYLLQSTEDPSLLVSAAQAWDDDGSLSRWLARPQELLLAELGRASRVYPELAAGLRVARPTGLTLDVDGAYRFLTEIAGSLDEAGFGVLLPSWWDRKRAPALVGAATPVEGVVAGVSRFGRNQLVDFSWQLAVGEDILTEAEIAALARAKAPLVRLRGQWVAVDQDQLRRGLEFLTRRGHERKTVGEVLALAAAHPDDIDTPLDVAAVRASGPLGALLDGTAGQTLRPLDPPKQFAATLRPYQRRGLAWLAFLSSLGLGSCLADDMGLGKTVQLLALEALDRPPTKRRGKKTAAAAPTLLICPVSLVGNWQREAAKFAPWLRIYLHHGRDRHTGDELADILPEVDMVVTTYAIATRDMDQLAEFDWHRVVLDEAQAVKNSASLGARAVRRLRAGHRVALTGTPVENRLAELWAVIDFINRDMLGSAEQFRTRYAIPVERYGHTEPARRLRAITQPYVLRRLKTDPTIIDDLPEKIEIKQYCRLTTEQASLYQSVVDDMMEKIETSDGIARRGNVLAAMAKLKQICNHPAQLLHDRSSVGRRSGKVIRLEEILEEILAEGDRVLCFTQFTEFAELLIPHLVARFGIDIAYLHGGTTKKRRDEMVTAFQAGEGPPIFLLSLKAGGTGLTLTAANHVIHLDRWWNPAVENQATDRAFRIGQRRNVAVHKFICTGTLEEKIDGMLEDKKALADLVVGDGESWLTELSTADLRTVFALAEDAVDD